MTPVITFVCWGNICRSPMAEIVARQWAEREGVKRIGFTSAGVSSEEEGNPIDPRAAEVLRQAGYRLDDHRAHRITPSEVRGAAMLIGMERVHLNRIHQMVPDARNLLLLSDFDPDAHPGSGVPDPWYGPPDGFNQTLAAIEAAMPEVIKHARGLVVHNH